MFNIILFEPFLNWYFGSSTQAIYKSNIYSEQHITTKQDAELFFTIKQIHMIKDFLKDDREDFSTGVLMFVHG